MSDCNAKVFVADEDLLQGLDGLKLKDVQIFAARRAEATAPLLNTTLRLWQAVRDATSQLETAACVSRGAMVYTSGTTGRPKGIRRARPSAEQLARGLEMTRYVHGFEPGMRVLMSAPMYHSAPNVYCIGAALESAQLFIEERFDPEQTLRLIEQKRITHAYLVPTMFVRLLRLPDEVRHRYDTSSMRFVGNR